MFLYQRPILQKMLFASKNLIVNPTVSFATTCWEKDWEILLKKPTYLKNQLIGYNDYAFLEKILIINNVKDPEKVKFFAQKRVDEGLLTHFYFAADLEKEVLDFFQLKKEDFKSREEGVLDDWVYYNASGILTALYKCRGEFFLYHTGDACLEKKVSWIEKAIKLMNKHPDYKIANLSWNRCLKEVKQAAFKKEKGFFVSENGFSDQQFLVRSKDFQKPIFHEIRDDSHHFPWGDTFEKRVFSFMKNHGWKRITYGRGSYLHRSF